MMDHNFWLSMFGAITGFAGLVLHFWRYLQEKPRVNIYIPCRDKGRLLLGYVNDLHRRDSLGQPVKDPTKCMFYLWTRISNQSDKPITLLELKLHIHPKSVFVLDSDSYCVGFMPVDSRSSRRITPLIKPILSIEPHSALEGYLFFGPASSIPKPNSKATLHVSTTRKTFKTKLRISVDRSNEQLFELEP